MTTPYQTFNNLLIDHRINPGFTYTDERILSDLLTARENITNPEAIKHLDVVIEIVKRDLDIID